MIGKTNRLVGATLLVSGTTIGAAVLALPTTAGQAGFFPALLVMLGVWLIMLLTAFYLLEVNLRMKGESNLISMMHLTLGKPGEIVSWIVYLLLLYSLSSSYLVGCSRILEDALEAIFSFAIADWVIPACLFVIFGSVIYFGTVVVDYCNRFFMSGLALAYVALVALGAPHINPSFLTYYDWNFWAAFMSIVVTSFGYHIIIPTLSTYLEHDVRALKKAIFIGSSIPLVLYLVWMLLCMGVVPVKGALSLEGAYLNGEPATIVLKQIIGSPWVTASARVFSLFAIITSLLGVSLSLSDFLSDGLKIKKSSLGKVGIVFLTFLPPFLFALFYPQGFSLALSFAGIFVVILLAIFPILMAYFERYGKETSRSFIPSQFTVFGGKILIIVALLIAMGILFVEVIL